MAEYKGCHLVRWSAMGEGWQQESPSECEAMGPERQTGRADELGVENVLWVVCVWVWMLMGACGCGYVGVDGIWL